MVIGQRRLTLQEFLALPEDEPALEYFAGDVTQKMSPKPRHGSLQTEIAQFVGRLCGPRRLARAFTETRATFGGASVVPDVIIYRWDRIPSDEHGDLPEDFTTPPDVAIEIASPGQSITDLIERCRWYVENGVRAALMLNPSDRSVRDLRPGRAPVKLVVGDELDLSDVLPGLRISLAELFRALRARYD